MSTLFSFTWKSGVDILRRHVTCTGRLSTLAGTLFRPRVGASLIRPTKTKNFQVAAIRRHKQLCD
jgi:hypothetical protein